MKYGLARESGWVKEFITTLQGAWAAVNGIEASLKEGFTVESLQSYYSRSR